jgi:nicotine oxidoreductase
MRIYCHESTGLRYTLMTSKSCGLRYYPYISPASELGEGESSTLNIASLPKGGKGLNQISLAIHRAESSMSKAILLESNLPGASTWGPYRVVWDRICATCKTWKWKVLQWIVCNQGAISTHNVKSWGSKDDHRTVNNTTGWPTTPKSHGHRGVIRERTPGINVCNFSSTAESFSTVSTDGLGKVQKIRKLCENNKEFIVEDKLYRLLYDKNLFYAAYNRIKSKPGNMTPGINPTTLDGISEEVILKIIDSIRNETFDFQPGRRVEIPKANGGTRPLTVAPPRDKLVQECMRMILDAIYEPTFKDNSHGFRPNRSCHTALRTARQKFVVARWFIEGDISKCFDTIDHNKLLNILSERIKDQRFINLIRKSLKAGYMEFTIYSHSVAGTPQGSIISPILANIYLDKLDRYVAKLKEDFDIGTKATINPVYKRLSSLKDRTKDPIKRKELMKTILQTPSKLDIDPKFKKMEYIRYADDWIIGVRGSLEDCKTLVEKIREFLKTELNLELSEKKTKITNAKKENAEFLSVRIKRSNHQTYSRRGGNTLKRNVKNMRMLAPIDKITKKLYRNGYMKKNRPYPKFIWMREPKDAIILLYNSVYRGIMNYYRFADNFNKLSSKVHYILKESCVRLLTAKFTLKTQAKTYAKYGKSLKGKDKHSFIKVILGINTAAFNTKTNDILLRVNAGGISTATLEGLVCSLCDSDYRVEMHHVRMMKDLNPKANKVDKIMARKNRKQIPLCRACHMKHHGAGIHT